MRIQIPLTFAVVAELAQRAGLDLDQSPSDSQEGHSVVFVDQRDPALVGFLEEVDYQLRSV